MLAQTLWDDTFTCPTRLCVNNTGRSGDCSTPGVKKQEHPQPPWLQRFMIVYMIVHVHVGTTPAQCFTGYPPVFPRS